MSSVSSLLGMGAGPGRTTTPQRGCRPLAGPAAAAKEERRHERSAQAMRDHHNSASPVRAASMRPEPTTGTARRGPTAKTSGSRSGARAPWTNAFRTRQARRPRCGHRLGRSPQRRPSGSTIPTAGPAIPGAGRSAASSSAGTSSPTSATSTPDRRRRAGRRAGHRLPLRDNLHLVWAEITVHPDHRRLGHGHAIWTRRCAGPEAGRARLARHRRGRSRRAAFLESYGFRYASHDARRRQVLADVDQAEVDRLLASRERAAADYELSRAPPRR